MVKIAIIVSLAVCALGLLFGLYYNEILLPSYGITMEKREPKPSGCPLPATWIKEQKFLYCLCRENGERIVCVVEGKNDGTVILNPRHPFGGVQYDYGFIPATTDLTKKITDALFGNPVQLDSDRCTYRLVVRSELPRTDKKVVYLDLKFLNNKLHDFRVRSRELESTDWVRVQKEEKAGET